MFEIRRYLSALWSSHNITYAVVVAAIASDRTSWKMAAGKQVVGFPVATLRPIHHSQFLQSTGETYHPDDLNVLTLREWAALNSISFPAAKRIFTAGEGPQTIQLSPRRVGARMIDNRRWQERRIRS